MAALTKAQLDELEKHARDEGSEVAGVCTVEAVELLELVIGYRLLLLASELVGEFRGPPPAPDRLECLFCKQPRQPNSKFCERHAGGTLLSEDFLP